VPPPYGWLAHHFRMGKPASVQVYLSQSELTSSGLPPPDQPCFFTPKKDNKIDSRMRRSQTLGFDPFGSSLSF